MPRPKWIRRVVIAGGAGFLLVTVPAAFFGRELIKQAFLGIAGFTVDTVKDHTAAVVGGSIAAIIVLWLVVIAKSICEARSERSV